LSGEDGEYDKSDRRSVRDFCLTKDQSLVQIFCLSEISQYSGLFALWNLLTSTLSEPDLKLTLNRFLSFVLRV